LNRCAVLARPPRKRRRVVRAVFPTEVVGAAGIYPSVIFCRSTVLTNAVEDKF
jgi:hypothetical protein